MKGATRYSQVFRHRTLKREFRFLYSSASCQNSADLEKKTKGKTENPEVRLPNEADVVIIGGGSLGCSTLYHLGKLGITNSVLLESHKLTAGTTWHTAGLVWRLRPNDTEIQLLNKTRELLQVLEEETGVNPGWINNGGLFIASNKERLMEYKRLMTLGKSQNIESHILDPVETKKLYPLMNIEDVYGSLYSPGDGTVEPSGYCSALTRSARAKGAKIFENCPVTNILTIPTAMDGKKVSEVHTPFGVIKTGCVVNASGAWSPYIANMVGIDIPLVAMKHAYVVTERIPGIENMPNVRDHDASVYLKLQGDALSVGGYENNPIILDKIDNDFAFGLFDLDWNVFSSNIEGAVNRIPVLEKIGIKSTVCGPESFTPDHKPLMGEDPNVSGFFHCCGFNSAGMMLSGGCGDQMAKWVAKGRPEYDMFGYDIRRFRTSLNSNREWVIARSHESYAKNYSIVFAHDEPLAERGQMRSPLHQILESGGCVFQERHGWERPGWFASSPCPVQKYDWYGAYDTPENQDTRYKTALTSDYSFEFPPHHHMIQDECNAARSKAALFDMSYFGKYYLTGPDAQKVADWIFSANVQKDAGSVVYTCMLNEMGGTEADLTVSILDPNERVSNEPEFSGRGFYLAVGGAAALQNWAHVTKEIRINDWKVNLTNCSDQMSLLSLQGPLSRKILQEVSSESFTNEDFPFSTHKIISIDGHVVRALRLSFVGELGWEFHVPLASTIPVYEAIHAAGLKHNLVNAGYRAMDSLSAEKGYVHWHVDLRLDDSPLEAGLGFACKLKTSTPFLGRKALEEKKKEGLKKKLVTLTVDSDIPLWGLEAILRDDVYVGFLRRAESAFTLNRTIAYGYVRKPDGGTISKEFLESGCWQIEAMGDRFNAELHTKSPFDPKNLRLKGLYPD